MPFGESFVEQQANTGFNNPYKFTGHELDKQTGLYYAKARFYSPKRSIFLSVDPLVEKTMQPYQYANQNPIRFIDPTGMTGQDWVEDKNGNRTNDPTITSQEQAEAKGLKYLGEQFRDGDLHYAANGKIYDDSPRGGGLEIPKEEFLPTFTYEKPSLFSLSGILDFFGGESSSDTFYIAMNSTGYGGTQNSGPNVRPQDKVEPNDLLEWLGISKSNGGFGGKGEGTISNLIGAGKNLFDVFGGGNSSQTGKLYNHAISIYDIDSVKKINSLTYFEFNKVYSAWQNARKDTTIQSPQPNINVYRVQDSINKRIEKYRK